MKVYGWDKADAAQERTSDETHEVLREHAPEGCEGCRAKAASMTQTRHREACRKRMEQALDGDEAGRELCRKNTERENQRQNRR